MKQDDTYGKSLGQTRLKARLALPIHIKIQKFGCIDCLFSHCCSTFCCVNSSAAAWNQPASLEQRSLHSSNSMQIMWKDSKHPKTSRNISNHLEPSRTISKHLETSQKQTLENLFYNLLSGLNVSSSAFFWYVDIDQQNSRKTMVVESTARQQAWIASYHLASSDIWST